jgi:hypothetical protein
MSLFQMTRVTCGTSSPSLLYSSALLLPLPLSSSPDADASSHALVLAATCIDGIWAAGGSCSIGLSASSRGCCPIEMCARVIMAGEEVDLLDDVVQRMQQLFCCEHQQYSGMDAWKLALPALLAFIKKPAATDFSEVWAHQHQVCWGRYVFRCVGVGMSLLNAHNLTSAVVCPTQTIVDACAHWCMWATDCLIPSTELNGAVFSSGPLFHNKSATARLTRYTCRRTADANVGTFLIFCPGHCRLLQKLYVGISALYLAPNSKMSIDWERPALFYRDP